MLHKGNHHSPKKDTARKQDVFLLSQNPQPPNPHPQPFPYINAWENILTWCTFQHGFMAHIDMTALAVCSVFSSILSKSTAQAPLFVCWSGHSQTTNVNGPVPSTSIKNRCPSCITNLPSWSSHKGKPALLSMVLQIDKLTLRTRKICIFVSTCSALLVVRNCWGTLTTRSERPSKIETSSEAWHHWHLLFCSGLTLFQASERTQSSIVAELLQGKA